MNLYVSLVASLPLVKMTEPPQMSYGKFISDCTGQIDARNLELLKKLSPVPGLPRTIPARWTRSSPNSRRNPSPASICSSNPPSVTAP